MNVVIATKWFILQWLILCNTNFTLIFQKLEKIIIIPKSLGSEDSLEEDMATHFSILAWRSPADRGVWRATVHWVKKSWTRLSNWGHTHTHTHTHTNLGEGRDWQFEQTQTDSDGQRSLACCSPCGHQGLDTTQQLSNNKRWQGAWEGVLESEWVL